MWVHITSYYMWEHITSYYILHVSILHHITCEYMLHHITREYILHHITCEYNIFGCVNVLLWQLPTRQDYSRKIQCGIQCCFKMVITFWMNIRLHLPELLPILRSLICVTPFCHIYLVQANHSQWTKSTHTELFVSSLLAMLNVL